MHKDWELGAYLAQNGNEARGIQRAFQGLTGFERVGSKFETFKLYCTSYLAQNWHTVPL
jgi:hypothetical protein